MIFRTTHQVQYGDVIKVVGQGPQLGKWEVGHAPGVLCLQCRMQPCTAFAIAVAAAIAIATFIGVAVAVDIAVAVVIAMMFLLNHGLLATV